MPTVNMYPVPAPAAPPVLPYGAGGGGVIGGQTLEPNKAYLYDLNGGDPGGALNLPAAALLAEGDEILLTRVSAGLSAVIYTLTLGVGSLAIQDAAGAQNPTLVLADAGIRSVRLKYQAAQGVWYVIDFF
jgi:hypothetical protein